MCALACVGMGHRRPAISRPKSSPFSDPAGCSASRPPSASYPPWRSSALATTALWTSRSRSATCPASGVLPGRAAHRAQLLFLQMCGDQDSV